MVDITENFETECLLQVQTFFESICGKCSVGNLCMDGWIKLPPPPQKKKKKKKRKYYLLMKCSVSTQKNIVRDLHAADFRYYLDCWLTTISSFIY